MGRRAVPCQMTQGGRVGHVGVVLVGWGGVGKAEMMTHAHDKVTTTVSSPAPLPSSFLSERHLVALKA